MDDRALTPVNAVEAAVPVVQGEALAEMELTTGGMSQDAADKLAAVTARAAGAPTAVIHLAVGDTLRAAGGCGLPDGFETIGRAPARATLAGWVITHGHPLIVTDVLHDARVPHDAPVRRVGARAYAGFPIRDPEGEIAGVCAVLDYEPRPWTAAELAGVDEGAQACTAFVVEQRAREAERAARREADQQHRFLDALLMSLRTGVAACDAEGRVVFANEAIRRLSDGACAWATPGAIPPEGGPLLRALAGERLRDVEMTVDRPGRPSTALLADAQPIVSADGRAVGAVLAVHDVTERRRADRFRHAQLNVAEALAGAETVGEAGAAVLDALATVLGWPHAELWLVDPDADVLVPAARYTATGATGAIDVPAQLRRGRGLAGTAWETGSTVWTHDIGGPGSLIGPGPGPGPDPGPDPGTGTARPPRTGLAVPIPSGGHVLAVLTCFAEAFEEPADALVVHLTSIAAHVGQFLERRRAEEFALALARSKDEYLALVGHELRTPLTSISAYLELLRDTDDTGLTAETRRMLDVTCRNSDVLRHIIDGLLDLAALDSGHAIVDADPVDLTAAVASVVDAASPTAAAAGVSIGADLLPEVVVTGDRARLAQVATHLLDNAVRHSTPAGRVTVTLTRPSPTMVELTVADTGIGIPDDEHRQVFTRFYRSSRTRDRGIPGAGLGLALSRAIVERHGGSIRLVPNQSPGTRIVVRLPTDGA